MKIAPVEIKSEKNASKLMASLGVSREGIKILSPKSLYSGFKVEGIKSWEANIIKQHLLSLGSDAAIERDALIKNIKTKALIFGNLSQLRKLCGKLSSQTFNLKEFSNTLSLYLSNMHKKEFVLYARDKVLKIKKPIICGIINVTSDSFSGDGLLKEAGSSPSKIKDLALKKCEEMIRHGAKIIDVGAESTRPFSKQINEEEEMRRVTPVLKLLRKKFKKAIISIDTYKYKVMKAAIDEGIDIINDITALKFNPQAALLIKKYKLGCILMHMKGMPQNMQVNPKYYDVVEQELDFFKERLGFCAKKKIDKNQILIDPGIGFGKAFKDNIKIINELYKFKIFGVPIFLGLSRKSFIGSILNVGVKERLIGTIAASITSISKGVNILRAHDVKETHQAINIACKISNN